MNKTELIEKIAAGASLTKADSKKALDATIAAITEALKKGDKVQLVGFGTFDVIKKPAREGINPATKQKISRRLRLLLRRWLNSRLVQSSPRLLTSNFVKK